MRILNQFQGVGLTSSIVIITWGQALDDLDVELLDQSFNIGQVEFVQVQCWQQFFFQQFTQQLQPNQKQKKQKKRLFIVFIHQNGWNDVPELVFQP